MMRLPPFTLARPSTVDEAVAILAREGPEARVLAGGTDLLVNLKHRLYQARVLVALDEIAALRGITRTPEGGLRIGASERLSTLATDPRVRAQAHALAEAAAKVAHPQAREMGTLGGNVCLDVRCHYVNRTPAWREALGGCLKSEGTLCHVVPGGKNCVAALSGDTLVALAALRAEAELFGPDGHRRVPVEKLRGKDGRQPLTLAPGELLVALRIPKASRGAVSGYSKWALRGAVDFPLVSVAITARLDEGVLLHDLRIAVGVLGPRPRLVSGLAAFEGRPAGETLGRDLAQRVCRQCTPLDNLLHDAAHRRKLLGVLVRRQIEAWAAP